MVIADRATMNQKLNHRGLFAAVIALALLLTVGSSMAWAQTTPTVTTATITSITSTAASGGGAIPDSGVATITAKGVCWNTSTLPTTANSYTTDGTGAASFTSSITSLSPATLYHVRAYATNSVGTAYGAEEDFTTLTTPTVTTATITSITSTAASGGGAIPDSGGATITAKGVCWNTSALPTTENSKTTDGTGAASFTSSITSLSPATLYHVRAYATNSVGTSYGAEEDFTTLQTFTISGYVRNSDSVGVDSVLMSGLPGDPRTDTNGYYTATVDYGWSGTVTPTDTCPFLPEFRTYDEVISDQANQNYVEECLSQGVDPDKEKTVPKDYQLTQNSPNPFNPSTEIAFGLPKATFVTLKIYNIMGQEVTILINKYLSAGTYHVRWNGKDKSGRLVSSGVYLYRMQAGDYLKTKQMLLLK